MNRESLKFRRLIPVAVWILCLIFASCDVIVKPISCAPIVPPRGYIYHHNKAPLILPQGDVHGAANYSKGNGIGIGKVKIQKPKQIVYIKVPIPRTYLLDMAFRHSDIENSIHQAGIKTILYADYEYLDILGYYRNFTVHAYGYKE